MDLLHVLVLGCVEGITEFLPISSTGHLILTSRILGLSQTDFVKSFEISIQLGAILSVIVLYGRSLMLDLNTIKRVIAAFIPTACIGLLFYKVIKGFLLGSDKVVLWSLLIGGIFIIVFEMLYKKRKGHIEDIKSISYKQAVLIGFFQSIAMVPGVSRSAATIIGGLSLGLSRKTIVEFSFLLAVPTMMAATGLDLIQNANAFSAYQIGSLFIGFLMSFVVALISIKFLLYFIKRYDFVVFGVYRILIASFFLLQLGG
jgi:undecaprenyl-diphosphatase